MRSFIEHEHRIHHVVGLGAHEVTSLGLVRVDSGRAVAFPPTSLLRRHRPSGFHGRPGGTGHFPGDDPGCGHQVEPRRCRGQQEATGERNEPKRALVLADTLSIPTWQVAGLRCRDDPRALILQARTRYQHVPTLSTPKPCLPARGDPDAGSPTDRRPLPRLQPAVRGVRLDRRVAHHEHRSQPRDP